MTARRRSARIFALAAISFAVFLQSMPAFADFMALKAGVTLLDSPKGKSIGKLSPGARVETLSAQGDMTNVQFEAWAPKSAFSKIPPLLARLRTLSVSEESAELMSDAGGGRAMGRISKEAKPEMKDIKGKWVKISLVAWLPTSAMTDAPGGGPRVRLSTTMGDIVVELDPKHAPKTTANFLSYTEKGHYNGTIFHRVIPNFMIQGGGFDTAYSQKPTDPPVPIESNNGLKNVRGTVAMARTNDPNSATSQFFINVVENTFLNFASDAQPGYTVFGHVVEGMDVVDLIRNIPTGPAGPLPSDVPKTMVVITKASKVE